MYFIFITCHNMNGKVVYSYYDERGMRMKRMLKGSMHKKVLSVLLSVAMVVTMTGLNPGPLVSASASEEDTVSVRVADLVQLKIGDNTYDMQSYGSNVFETGVELTANTYKVQLLVNGNVKLEKSDVKVSASDKVYFRLQNGELKTSLEDGVLHTAAVTGDMAGIQFLTSQSEDATTYELGNWKQDDPNGDSEYLGGGRYKKTFYMKALDVAKDVSYKVAFDDAWDYSIGDNGGNINVTIPAETTSFTVVTDEINKVVYDSVRSGSFELVQNSGNVEMPRLNTSVSLIGEARSAGDNNWAPQEKGYEFTQLSDTLYIYQKTFSAGTYNYKAVFNYDKWYEKGSNITLNIVSDKKNVVFLYDSATGLLYDTVNQEEEVANRLHMDVAVIKPSVNDQKDGRTSFVMSASAGATVNLVYGETEKVKTDGTSALKKLSMKENDGGKYVSENIFLGDAAIDLVYYYEVNGVRTVFDTMPCVSIDSDNYMNYTRAEFKGRIVNVPGSFPGPSWDAASNQMTYQGNGLYSYTFANVTPANYEYKISMGSWSENYGKDGVKEGANIPVTVAQKQDVTILYNDFSHKSVTSINYISADIAINGTGIPTGAKLTDDMLNGIYSYTILLPAGTYSDLKMEYDGKEYKINTFTLSNEKLITFYFDPVSEIYYNDASDVAINTADIYYNTKDTTYKSVYGAVATDEDVTFSIDTGMDIKEVKMVIKGAHKQNLTLSDTGTVENGKKRWSITTSFQKIGASTYYFVLSNGSSVTAYADDDGYYGEGGTTSLTSILPYDLIVYKSGYQTPDWMKNAVIYQIFPDRFFDGDTTNDRAAVSARGAEDYEYINDWGTLPENPEQEKLLDHDAYAKTGAYSGDGNWSNEIYGGDLKGITERIDYLKAVGVNVIYLNPVFASISSHRYDTSDYSKIDPILGTLGDFDELVKIAEDNDMHVILDGVFNHVSDDSVYFDRYYKYLNAGSKTLGAYPYWAYVYDLVNDKNESLDNAKDQAKDYFKKNYGITDFSYTEWFEVNNKPLVDKDTETNVVDTVGDRAGKVVYGYQGWWGYDSMPVILSTDGSEYQTGNWAEKVIGNDSETSVTQYWLKEGANGWRLDVANEVSDETWQQFRKSVKALNSDDVIVGEIWTDAVSYLLGDMYDSVMNYVFRNAVLSYVNGGDSADATKTLEKMRERYPKEAYYAMMNLIGSHDTSRLLSSLDGVEDDRKQKDVAHAFPTYEGTSDLAKQKQYLAAFMQFTYAGAPTIYYGDEIGMVGADDPDNRRGFTWGQGSKELVSWYAKLAKIRSEYTALRTGSMEPITVDDNVMGYVRRDDDDTMVVLMNNAQIEKEVILDLNAADVTADQLTDLISGGRYSVTDGKVTIKVPALSGVILTQNAKNIVIDQQALAPAYDSAYVVGYRNTPDVPKKPEIPTDPTNQTGDVINVSDTPAGNDTDQNTSQAQNGVTTADVMRTSAYAGLLLMGVGVAGLAYRKKKKLSTK